MMLIRHGRILLGMDKVEEASNIWRRCVGVVDRERDRCIEHPSYINKCALRAAIEHERSAEAKYLNLIKEMA